MTTAIGSGLGLPAATYSQVDQSAVAPVQLTGKHGLILATLFGPTDQPYDIESVSEFVSMFGGPDANAAPYFAAIRRALARGTKYRIMKLLATGAAAATLSLEAGDLVFNAKTAGTFANGKLGFFYQNVTDGNGTATFQIIYTPNTQLNETFTGSSFAAAVAAVNAGSKWVNIVLTSGDTEPASSTVNQYLAAGTDGTWASDTTHAVALNTALQSFNGYTDMSSIGALGVSSTNWLTDLAAYVTTQRNDLMGIFEIDPSITPAAALTFAQTNQVFGANLVMYYGSWVNAYSPEDGVNVNTPNLCDVQSVWSYSDTLVGNPFKAPAGANRGLIPSVLSYAYNLLSPANVTVANNLSNIGVNVIGNHPSFGPVIWNAITRNLGNSSLNAINVVRMLIQLNKDATPIFQTTLFEAQDPQSWRAAYGRMKILLNQYVSEEGINPTWTYVGDQFSSVIQDAVFNKLSDLQNGLYKVQLGIVPVGFIAAINLLTQVNTLQSLVSTTVTNA